MVSIIVSIKLWHLILNYIYIKDNTTTKQILGIKVVIKSRNVNKILMMVHKTINITFNRKTLKPEEVLFTRRVSPTQ